MLSFTKSSSGSPDESKRSRALVNNCLVSSGFAIEM